MVRVRCLIQSAHQVAERRVEHLNSLPAVCGGIRSLHKGSLPACCLRCPASCRLADHAGDSHLPSPLHSAVALLLACAMFGSILIVAGLLQEWAPLSALHLAWAAIDSAIQLGDPLVGSLAGSRWDRLGHSGATHGQQGRPPWLMANGHSKGPAVGTAGPVLSCWRSHGGLVPLAIGARPPR